MIKTLIIALMAIAAPLLAEHQKDITGDYFVRRFNSSHACGEPDLVGCAQITREDEIYSIHWNYNDNSVFKGTGLLVCDQISFSFRDEGEITSHGVIVYKIKKDILSGPWVFFDGEEVGFEMLIKQ